MNRLKGLRFYTAGPIDHAKDIKEEIDWRQEVRDFITPKGGYVFSPIDSPGFQFIQDDSFRESVVALKKQEKYDDLTVLMKEIVRVDLRMVDIVDCLVVKLDMDVPTCGTYHEIFTATLQHKPVLIWCKQGKSSIPSWLFGVIPHAFMFDSLSQILTYLEHIDVAPYVESHNKWLFFNYDKK